MDSVLLSSKKMDWCTPQDFFDELDGEFVFALDAAATKKSAKCIRYFTPEDDGLKQPWDVPPGYAVFCNPPYGRQIGEWVKKAYDESVHTGGDNRTVDPSTYRHKVFPPVHIRQGGNTVCRRAAEIYGRGREQLRARTVSKYGGDLQWIK